MNIPTIIVLAIVILAFAAIVTGEIKKFKKGKGSCSCGCAGCNMEGICHGEKAEKE